MVNDNEMKGSEMSENTGGPAFPATNYIVPQDLEARHVHALGKTQGMTLRDYFAAKFAAAWIIALSARYAEPGYLDTDVVHEANRRGLEQADAILPHAPQIEGTAGHEDKP